MSATPLASFPVAVLMARKMIRRSAWALPSWEALGVFCGEQFKDAQPDISVVHEEGDLQHIMYRGLTVELYRDAAETYWWNLTAERPSLFVICDREAGEELVPRMVTADHEAAQAAVEREAVAYAVPIPPEIHAAIETVVLEHYRPEAPRKRKQHQWRKEDEQ
jgi:hypothetical protein